MMSHPRILSLLLAVVLAAPLSLLADDTVYTSVDVSPVPVKTPPPKYPPDMKRAGIAGVVAVSIVIDEKGSVVSSTVVKSSKSEFEEPALEAVKVWRFKPAQKAGVAVKSKVTVPLRFNLDD